MNIIKEKSKITKSLRFVSNVFLMGHKNLDLDALGSQVALYKALEQKKKKCYIIIDDINHELGVKKVLKELDNHIRIINSNEINNYMSEKTKKNLLIILDTNKKELVQNPNILDKIDRKLIIDHHDTGKTTIKKALMIIDKKVSSTCEMIANLIEYYDINLDSYCATLLLAGIVLDTNNYMLNTQTETFYTSYYLAASGASASKVQYLLKQDIKDYTERQKLLSDIETINEKIAITKGSTKTIYRKEDLAKTADTLLYFNNIEASFVIGKIDKNIVGISARSLGSYNIVKILEKLGGGGDNYNAAAQLNNITIQEAEKKLKEIIKKEGE